MKRDDYPDTTNRREMSAYIRRRIMLRRIDNFCELCGTHCHILTPEQVAADITKLRAIVDYLLREDPNARIHIRRGRDHEFMLSVECDDADIAEKLNFSRECNQGLWFRAEVRTRDTHAERPIPGGVYQHYKGDCYTVIGFAFHHETREELVLYRSHEKGWINARPLRGSPLDPDGWLTPFEDDQGNTRPRFMLAREPV